MTRWIEKITMIHRVHHIHFGYGWICMPFSVGYFPDFAEVHRLQGATPWHRVEVRHYHDCTVTGIY